MRFSPATRLKDRQTVWVGYKNDGGKFNLITDPVGFPATLISAQWSELHHREAIDRLPQWAD